jgi:hypothetical protein
MIDQISTLKQLITKQNGMAMRIWGMLEVAAAMHGGVAGR